MISVNHTHKLIHCCLLPTDVNFLQQADARYHCWMSFCDSALLPVLMNSMNMYQSPTHLLCFALLKHVAVCFAVGLPGKRCDCWDTSHCRREGRSQSAYLSSHNPLSQGPVHHQPKETYHPKVGLRHIAGRLHSSTDTTHYSLTSQQGDMGSHLNHAAKCV